MSDDTGFIVTCGKCEKPDGQIGGGTVNGKPHVIIRCPHCPRVIAKPVDGTQWFELRIE